MKLTLLILTLFGATLCAQPVTVILVRHAEKAARPADDPPLTGAGKARAKELARVLRDIRPAAVYVTQFRRTQDTARPLATAAGVTPAVVPDAGDLAARLSKHAGKTAVVVGHSNTVPEVIRKLGGPAVTIDEKEFDHLYVLTVHGPGRASLVPLRYGKQ
jgi:broad specificity phosphatase PhoE